MTTTLDFNLKYRFATDDEQKLTESGELAVYDIPLSACNYLQEKMDKLNKRANKLGLAELELIYLGEYTETRQTDDGQKYPVEFLKLAFIGPTVKFNGWELIAVVTPTEAGNLVNTVPGKTYPKEFRSVSTERCDHCNVARYRKDVFIVYNEDKNEYKVVGRQCIKDFLGHNSPEHFLNLASWVTLVSDMLGEISDEGEGWGSSGSVAVFSLSAFLKTASIVIRKFGFVSKSKADYDDNPTVNEIMYLLDPRSRSERFKRIWGLYPEDIDATKAQNALDWILSDEIDTDNDYYYNLKIAASLPYVSWKTAGLMASLIPAYNRAKEKQEENEAENQPEYLGEVGQRYGFEKLYISHISYHQNSFGSVALVKLFDNQQNQYIIWTSGQAQESFENAWEAGDSVDVTATVKKHEEYRGKKQNTLARPVIGIKGKYLKAIANQEDKNDNAS